jgi:hypothetical protein
MEMPRMKIVDLMTLNCHKTTILKTTKNSPFLYIYISLHVDFFTRIYMNILTCGLLQFFSFKNYNFLLSKTAILYILYIILQ